jgi:flagellar hook assembly protein FlgD
MSKSRSRQFAEFIRYVSFNQDGTPDIQGTANDDELNAQVTTLTAEKDALASSLATLQVEKDALATQVNNITTDVVDDTTPQLGGALDTNGNNINFGDNVKAQFGASNDLQIYHNGTQNRIESAQQLNIEAASGDVVIRGTDNIYLQGSTANETFLKADENGAVTLYHDNSAKLATTSTGVSVTGTLTATSFSGDGSALTGIQAGDGHYLGRHRGKMNGGYYGGIGFTGLPVGKTLVVACLSMLNSTGQEFTAYTNSGGGSPGFQGGSWRKGQDKTNNSHQPVYFNYSGSNPLDRLDNESSAFSSNQGFSSRTMAFVQLTSSTASIPLYGGGRFEWVCDIYLIG